MFFRPVVSQLVNSKYRRFPTVRCDSGGAGLVWTIGILYFLSSFALECQSKVLYSVNNTTLSLAKQNVPEPKLFFTDNPDAPSSIIGSWFTFTSFTLSLAFFGLTFMIACIATASYYVLVVVTEPSQQVRRMDLLNPQPYTDWNWVRILRLINLAYQTYSTLDLDSMDCQNKILCELQETPGIVGRTTRRVSNFLMYFNVFKSVPHIRDYQEAVERGQMKRRRTGEASSVSTSTSELGAEGVCGTYYQECHFSVNNFNREYIQLFSPSSEQQITTA